MQPTLYWISGSPPAWRVMLAMALKDVPFTSRNLDHAKGDNRTSTYLALNPKGQVPTVTFGNTVIRESIAILAWLDRAFPGRPIFGSNAEEAAVVWQDLMLMETDLRPVVMTVAQVLLRGRIVERSTELAVATSALQTEADALSGRVEHIPFLGGAEPMAADIWLYPAVGWIDRAAKFAGDDAPSGIAQLVTERLPLARWRERMAALPGVLDTHPPHWND